MIDHTHDKNARSWLESANEAATDFPIQNLPFCVFSDPSEPENRIGVGIGDQIIDLKSLSKRGLFPEKFTTALNHPSLNLLMEFDVSDRTELRHALFDLLKADSEFDREVVVAACVSQSECELHLPAFIRDYTDFFASIFHATNVGCMFRPNNPLLPNYKHIPIGYHGRASSVVVSGTPIKRPVGQKTPHSDDALPKRGPSRTLDYEMEVGCFIAKGNELGETISLAEADEHLFGLCLLNDWSARDIQKWEYVPLGPFLAKSFATSISPWVVTREALLPFRCAARKRTEDDPTVLPYLSDQQNDLVGGFDLAVAVFLSSQTMRDKEIEPIQMSRCKFTEMYWTFAQMLTHHSSNGCNMAAGDLIGSGTVSGSTRDTYGSMLEKTWAGSIDNPVEGKNRLPLGLPTGETRTFLEDGDEVIFQGYCESEGFRRIGFGECRGEIKAASF